METIQVRQIAPTDNASVANMIRQVFEEYNAPKTGTVYSDATTDALYELFQTPGSLFWVAADGDEIVGSCGVFPTEGLPAGHAELVKFYLNAKYRGKGIGKELMKKTIESAKDLGYTHLYIESLPLFNTAVAMYERAGFQHLTHALGNSGHTTCDIWMLKEL